MHENLWIEDFSSSKTWIIWEAGVKLLLILLQRVFVRNFAGGGIWVLPKQVEKPRELWRWKTACRLLTRSEEDFWQPAKVVLITPPASWPQPNFFLTATFFETGSKLLASQTDLIDAGSSHGPTPFDELHEITWTTWFQTRFITLYECTVIGS